MPKNALATTGKKQFIEVTTLIKDPAQRSKLQNYIDEVIRCKTKILDEQESIKALRDAAVEELNIEPKMFTQLVSLFFNNNFEQKRAELERLEAAINALMQTGD
jgi:hypothetical protein